MTDAASRSLEDPVAAAQRRVLEPLAELCERLVDDVDDRPLAFFSLIRQGIEQAREPEDLAGPFLELSTSAFRGFAFDPMSALLLDQVLEAAQRLAATLSASGDAAH